MLADASTCQPAPRGAGWRHTAAEALVLGRSVSRASLAPSREPPAPSKFASRNHRRAESDDEVTVAGVTGVW